MKNSFLKLVLFNFLLLSFGATVANAASCTPVGDTFECYDDNDQIVAEFDKDHNPIRAYDRDENGNTTVYDDECKPVERFDTDGYPLPMHYEVGDGLLAEDRKETYSPAEVAEIMGDSKKSNVILYFK